MYSMGKINSIERLVEELDKDLQWRKKEIADLRMFCEQGGKADCQIRSSFSLTCAHFEGFIRYGANAYMEYIASQNILVSDLRIELGSLLIRKSQHTYFNGNGLGKVKATTISKVLTYYEDILGKPFNAQNSEKDGQALISTESNPKPEVLMEISDILGIDYSELFGMRAPFIESELLAPRNNIVHGQRWKLEFNDLDAADTYVIELLDNYKDAIINAAQKKTYLRS